ncbi:FAD-dependent oxidoreductase [Paraburkholderia caledonica]
MPSKAALHAGAVYACGEAGHPDRARANLLWRDARLTRDRLATGVAQSTRELADSSLLSGEARIAGPNLVQVDDQLVCAQAIIIATGTAPIVPPEWRGYGSGILTTDTLFEMEEFPGSMGIIGLGPLGLEMGVAMSRLGVRVTAAGRDTTVAGIVDPVIAAGAQAHFHKGMSLWLGQDVDCKPVGGAAGAPPSFVISAAAQSATVERVLVALGRRSALSTMGLETAGVSVCADGTVTVDETTMRIGDSCIYLAGDVSGTPELQREAADEGSIAGWNAARHAAPTAWRRRVPLSITFTDPDIASIGCRFDRLPARALIGEARGSSNGRSKITGHEDNLVRVYADPESGRLLGAAVLSVGGEHLAHLLAWAMQRGETVAGLLERCPSNTPQKRN